MNERNGGWGSVGWDRKAGLRLGYLLWLGSWWDTWIDTQVNVPHRSEPETLVCSAASWPWTVSVELSSHTRDMLVAPLPSGGNWTPNKSTYIKHVTQISWTLKSGSSQVLVAHAYNPSYSGGRDRENSCLKPAQANSPQDQTRNNLLVEQNPS
jgi:hypothetical protein